jgi:phosphonate transport system ATP-binding protein
MTKIAMIEKTVEATAIVCQNLETPYLELLRRPILDQVSFSVAPGEFVGLLGLNGAGKSTLLRSLVGLVPLRQGDVYIGQLPMTPRALPELRQQVGMLFQGGGLIPQLSALDNVLCGRLGRLSAWQTLFGFSLADRRQALALLAELGLKHQAEQKTCQLSGGQQQRVAIARALMQSPQILLADEPTAGLDVLAIRQVMDTLQQLNRERGMTVITVLHDLAIAAAYTDRVLVLENGKIIYDGSPQTLPPQLMSQQYPAVA